MLLLWTGDLPRAGDLIEQLIAYAWTEYPL